MRKQKKRSKKSSETSSDSEASSAAAAPEEDRKREGEKKKESPPPNGNNNGKGGDGWSFEADDIDINKMIDEVVGGGCQVRRSMKTYLSGQEKVAVFNSDLKDLYG